jgi:hypothetical protein
MNKVTESAKKAEESIINMEDTSEKDAKNRQGWMPIGGVIVCGLILFAALALFLGWY